MRVAGFGFRKGTAMSSLGDALDAAGGGAGLTHVATVAVKAGDVGFEEFAAMLGLPVIAVAQEALAEMEVATRSERSMAVHATGSVSEAAALAAAGEGARLVVTRRVSSDRMATCAIAEGKSA